ncbi:hypothetical protein BDQ12DRAFT_669657 [Crucibulum laeve]|uniref:Uncharacterized protein n=1 Tax=Crucibulum laeve TaxID=68775 RepID=A0A5C3LMT0_9AGAR|nr:hypothetical protein BDQ12DRAFT_669657 [Crucibulum laeve]
MHAPPLQQRCGPVCPSTLTNSKTTASLRMIMDDGVDRWPNARIENDAYMRVKTLLNASKSENSAYMRMKMLSIVTKAVFRFIQKTTVRATMKTTTELHDENSSRAHNMGPQLAHDGDQQLHHPTTRRRHQLSSFGPVSSRDNNKDNQALPTKHSGANFAVHSMHIVLLVQQIGCTMHPNKVVPSAAGCRIAWMVRIKSQCIVEVEQEMIVLLKDSAYLVGCIFGCGSMSVLCALWTSGVSYVEITEK